MLKISAFIIAKNEEARIETALQSLTPFCDEIIVIDTGSTDRTKEIAQKHTANIFDFRWTYDFGAARNFALQKCTGEWIIWLDAGDRIDPDMRTRIKNLIENSTPDQAGFFINYQYSADQELLIPRIFRNHLGLKFVLPVHEYLEIPPALKKKFKAEPGIIIGHNFDQAALKSVFDRNLQILKFTYKKDPKDFTIKFFLAREYFNAGQYIEAEKLLDELLHDIAAAPDNSYRYLVLIHLGLVLRKLSKGRDAIIAFQRASELSRHFAEPLIYEADTWLYQMEEPEEARRLYLHALKIKKPLTTFPLNPANYHDYPKNQLEKIERLKMPSALICGNFGLPDHDDEPVISEIIKAYPKHRLIIASYNSELTASKFNLDSVPHRHAYFEHELKQSKLVIIAGISFSDSEDNSELEYFCDIINKSVTYGKTVILYGISVDKIGKSANRRLIRENFKLCNEIIVHDQASRENLHNLGLIAPLIKVTPSLFKVPPPSL